jgi:hypothetical protein
MISGISVVSAVSTGILSALSLIGAGQRKADLVAVGQWALASGRSALVTGVHRAIQQEGLRSA